MKSRTVPKLEARAYLPSGTVPLTIRYWNLTEPVRMHRHEFMELILVCGGGGRHRLEGQYGHEISRGDVMVITGQRAHGYEKPEGVWGINILFDPQWFFDATAWARGSGGYQALFRLEPEYRFRGFPPEPLHLDEETMNGVVGLAEGMIGEMKTRGPAWELVVVGLFGQMVGRLSRSYELVRGTERRGLHRMGRVLGRMEKHFAEPLTLEKLAREAHFSRRHFVRVFRQATGLTPIDYLLRVRINQARQMLQDGARSIGEVALAVGFSDGNYFSRQFKRITGRSPREEKRER
jgi:AraC-like DNA-binding protein